MISCSWKQTFGVDCPGCGAQRSVIDLFHGDFMQAYQHFPALLPLVISVLGTCVILVFPESRFRQIARQYVPAFFLITAAVMFYSWICKMPLIPRNYLWLFTIAYSVILTWIGIKITFASNLKLHKYGNSNK